MGTQYTLSVSIEDRKEYYLGHVSSLVVNKRARRQLIAS